MANKKSITTHGLIIKGQAFSDKLATLRPKTPYGIALALSSKDKKIQRFGDKYSVVLELVAGIIIRLILQYLLSSRKEIVKKVTKELKLRNFNPVFIWLITGTIDRIAKILLEWANEPKTKRFGNDHSIIWVLPLLTPNKE